MGHFFSCSIIKNFWILNFILMDIFCVFIILLIFFKIYSFSFASKTSILLSIFIFLIPIIISNTSLQIFNIFGYLERFYAQQKPMITNIYFLFHSLVLKMTLKISMIIRYFFIGAILGFSLSSHHFFTEIIFFIFLAYKFKIYFDNFNLSCFIFFIFNNFITVHFELSVSRK